MHASDHRLYGADFIRASACVIVLFHHLAQRADYRSALGANPFIEVFTSVGGLGVAMFFVLSGFLLARPFWLALDEGRPMPSLRIYALRRLARIVPGFWLALTVSFVLSVTVFGFALDGWLWLRYASGLLLVSDWHWTTLFPVEINGPLWSIGFEATSYFLLPLGFVGLLALGRGKLRGWPARIAWIAVILAAMLAHLVFISVVEVDPLRRGWDFGLQGGAKTWMPWFNPFSFFAMFAVGALGAGIGTLLTRSPTLLCDLVAGICLLTIGSIIWTKGLVGGGEFYGLLRIPYEFPVFPLLVALTLATAPSGLVLGRILDNPPVRFIARISFGIYIWHYLVLELVRLYWVPSMVHAGISDPVEFLIASGVITAITLVVSTLSWRWLEEPVLRRARLLERAVAAQRD